MSDDILYEPKQQTYQSGKGRPYKGKVDTSDGIEKNVKEKRSMFRAFKEFIEYFIDFKEGKLKQRNHDLEPLFVKLESAITQVGLYSVEDKTALERMILQCRSCFSKDYVKNHHIDTDLHYNTLIGDVCYRYKKQAKQAFICDFRTAYLFLQSCEYLYSKYSEGQLLKKSKLPIDKQTSEVYHNIISEIK